MAWKMTSPTKVTNDIFDEVLGYTRAVNNPNGIQQHTTLVSRTSGRPITFGWTFTDRHIAVIWETACDKPKMIRVRTAYEVEPKGRRA
jgi:hypothetical protein